MEREIQNELLVILEYLRKSQNKVLSPNSFISQAVMNVLWKYVAGIGIGTSYLGIVRN